MKRLTFAKKAFIGVSLACALSASSADLKECRAEKDKMLAALRIWEMVRKILYTVFILP
ncbi:hypothetical protein [Campylobacter upsaliensis]|uniref:hypothetical protein n=1 Tax=Campylobacter upsaliensis TaxID=28080 RepID=UPI002B3A9640|nr:hypothetical protein [Campylobacter upsaliensis]MEB2816801.1 hypothetical protein [Campylobacter upsaliensis]